MEQAGKVDVSLEAIFSALRKEGVELEADGMIWNGDLCWLFKMAIGQMADPPRFLSLESFVLQGSERCLIDRRCFFRPPHL